MRSRWLPTITLLDSRGRALPFTYSHRGDQMITAVRTARQHLKAKASAYFAFNKNACDAPVTGYASTLRITLTGARRSRTVRLLVADRRIEYYRGDDLFKTVSVSPIEPTREDSFCRLQRSCGPYPVVTFSIH
jgi:hypothetical protein